MSSGAPSRTIESPCRALGPWLFVAVLATAGCAIESGASRVEALRHGERAVGTCCASRDLGELPPELAGLTWPALPSVTSEIEVHSDAQLAAALDRSANLRIRVHGSHRGTYFLRRSDVEIVLDADAWIEELLIARSQHRIRITGGALGSIQMLPPIDYPNGSTTPDERLMITDLTIECVTLNAADTALLVRGSRVAVLSADITAERYSVYAGTVAPLRIEDLIVANSVMRSSGPEATFRIHDVTRSVVVSSTFSNTLKHNWRVHGASSLNYFADSTLLGTGIMLGNEPGDRLDRQWFVESTFHYAATSGLFVVSATTVANLTVTDNVVYGDGPLTFPSFRTDWTIERNTMLPFVPGPSPMLSCPDSEPDAGADAGLDAGTDAGIDAGIDAGTDASADSGTDASADSGTDAGADSGTDASADSGTDASADSGTDAGADASMDAGVTADSGLDGGQETGSDASVLPLDAVVPGDDGGAPPCCASRELGTLPPALAGLTWPELPSTTSERDVYGDTELQAALEGPSNVRVRVHGAHAGKYFVGRSDLDIVLDPDASIEDLYIGHGLHRIRIAGGTLGTIEMPPPIDYSTGSATPDERLMVTDLTIECVTMTSSDTAFVVRGSRVAIVGADVMAARYALYAATPPAVIEDLVVAHSVLRSAGQQATVHLEGVARSVVVSTTLSNPSRHNLHVHGASSLDFIGQNTFVGTGAVLGGEPDDLLDRVWLVGNTIHHAASSGILVLSESTSSNLTITDNVAYSDTPFAPTSSRTDWTIARNTTLPYAPAPSAAFVCR